MAYCAVCAAEVQPVIDIAENGRPVEQCDKGHVIGVVPVPQPPGAPPQTAEGQPQRTVAPALDIVAAARERLRVIDAELERLGALQRERRKLAAMVAAAEAEDDAPSATRLQPILASAE